MSSRTKNEVLLLIDRACGPCSAAGRRVAEIGEGAIAVRGFGDAVVQEHLSEHPHIDGGRPALLFVARSGESRVLTAAPMRLWLLTHLGPRKAAAIWRIAAQAHRERQTSVGLDRRRFVGGALAGAAANVLLGPGRAMAAAQSGPSTNTGPTFIPAGSDEARDLRASESWTWAERAFGPVDSSSLSTETLGDMTLYLAPIPAANAFLILTSDPADGLGGLVLKTDRSTPEVGLFDWYLPWGTPVASQRVAERKVTVEAMPAVLGVTPASCTQPSASLPNFINCFVLCLNGAFEPDPDELDDVDLGCLLHCQTCGYYGPTRAPLDCVYCYFCFGHRAIKCARHCAKHYIVGCQA